MGASVSSFHNKSGWAIGRMGSRADQHYLNKDVLNFQFVQRKGQINKIEELWGGVHYTPPDFTWRGVMVCYPPPETACDEGMNY